MDQIAKTVLTKDLFDMYEAGKHRRYSLLFAVHGGAFAVARIWGETPNEAALVLGGLTLQALAAGMGLFTLIMVADIYTFGEKMRAVVASVQPDPTVLNVFGPIGKLVLILLGVLLVAAWLLAGFGPASPS